MTNLTGTLRSAGIPCDDDVDQTTPAIGGRVEPRPRKAGNPGRQAFVSPYASRSPAHPPLVPRLRRTRKLARYGSVAQTTFDPLPIVRALRGDHPQGALRSVTERRNGDLATAVRRPQGDVTGPRLSTDRADASRGGHPVRGRAGHRPAHPDRSATAPTPPNSPAVRPAGYDGDGVPDGSTTVRSWRNRARAWSSSRGERAADLTVGRAPSAGSVRHRRGHLLRQPATVRTTIQPVQAGRQRP